MYPVDLHCHSHYSPDGHLLVKELFTRAKQLNLRVLVITDHNTTGHFDEAWQTASEVNIETLEGIEVTTRWHGAPVHLLGYAYHFNRSVLHQGLRATIDGYNQLARQIIERLVKLGFPKLNLRELKRMTPGLYVSRHQIAKSLADQLGWSYSRAYSKLKPGGQAYIPYGDWAMSPQAAVALIKRAGGAAVLAHPGWSQKALGYRANIFDLIHELKNNLTGVEVNHLDNTQALLVGLGQLVKKLGLISTGGSDWHGTEFTGHYQLGDWGCSTREFLWLKEKLADH